MLAGLLASPARGAEPQPWTLAEDHPYPVAQRLAVAGDDGMVYLFGGLGGLTMAHAYDPVGDTYEQLTGLPQPTGGACGDRLPDGRIAVYGGLIGGTTYVDTIQIYDPMTDQWSVGTDKSGVWQCAAVADAGGKLHVFGGEGNQSRYVIYDVATDSWSTGPSMPLARHSHGAALGSAGKLYVFGGHYGNGDTMSVFDPDAQSWAAGPNLPAVNQQFGSASDGESIFVIGGSNTYNNNAAPYFEEVWIYDIAAQSWTIDDELLVVPVREAAAAIADGAIHVFGGSNGVAVVTHQMTSLGAGGDTGGDTGADDTGGDDDGGESGGDTEAGSDSDGGSSSVTDSDGDSGADSGEGGDTDAPTEPEAETGAGDPGAGSTDGLGNTGGDVGCGCTADPRRGLTGLLLLFGVAGVRRRIAKLPD